MNIVKDYLRVLNIISPLFSGSYAIELEDANTGNPIFYYVGSMQLTEDDYKKGFEALIEEMVVSRVVKNNLYRENKWLKMNS